MKEIVQGAEVKEGDSLYFPNSRRPQTVGSTTPTEEGTTVLLSADGVTRWVVPNHFHVEREVSESGN